jgi:hypothetical protein
MIDFDCIKTFLNAAVASDSIMPNHIVTDGRQEVRRTAHCGGMPQVLQRSSAQATHVCLVLSAMPPSFLRPLTRHALASPFHLEAGVADACLNE